MTKAEIKGLKPVAYKGALKSVQTYEKTFAKGKIVESKTISTFAEKVKPYLNKKGEIKGNLSAKKVAQFNALVDEFKHSEYRSVARIRAITKKAEKKFIEDHAGATTKNVQSIRSMIIEANQNKIKLDSSVAIQLADEAEDRPNITSDEFMQIFQEYIQRKKSLTPNKAGSAVGGDDTVMQIQELLEVYGKLKTQEQKDRLVQKVKDDKTLAQIKRDFRKVLNAPAEEKKVSQMPKTSRKSYKSGKTARSSKNRTQKTKRAKR